MAATDTMNNKVYSVAQVEPVEHPQEPQQMPADAPVGLQDSVRFFLNRENIIAGIIFSEILAVPKARMRKRSLR